MHGDENADAVHLAAFDDDDELVGTCLVLPRPYPLRPDEVPAWQLRGMATAEDRRGRGIGAQVLATAVAVVGKRGARLIWCEARTSAVPFYVRNGFTVDGEEYLHAESGIPHHYMWRPGT
jgi:predicted GNAT family N-acyltransferase